MDKPTNTADTWLILSTAHGKYICSTKLSESGVMQVLLDARSLECTAAYELLTPVNQVPSKDAGQFGIAKEAVATPIDVNSETALTFFNLAGARVNFFEHLFQADRVIYEKLIKMANELATAWRAHRMGISLT
jgi:hypothetical protein